MAGRHDATHVARAAHLRSQIVWLIRERNRWAPLLGRAMRRAWRQEVGQQALEARHSDFRGRHDCSLRSASCARVASSELIRSNRSTPAVRAVVEAVPGPPARRRSSPRRAQRHGDPPGTRLSALRPKPRNALGVRVAAGDLIAARERPPKPRPLAPVVDGELSMCVCLADISRLPHCARTLVLSRARPRRQHASRRRGALRCTDVAGRMHTGVFFGQALA
jgi:hypothetical protein